MHHTGSMKCYTWPRIFSESLKCVFYMVVDFRANYDSNAAWGCSRTWCWRKRPYL